MDRCRKAYSTTDPGAGLLAGNSHLAHDIVHPIWGALDVGCGSTADPLHFTGFICCAMVRSGQVGIRTTTAERVADES
jgi:hypothetical protein